MHAATRSAIVVLVRLLFLDFDGVLNSEAYFDAPEFLRATEGLSDAEVMLLGHARHLDPEKVALLNRLVETLGVGVVISSTWRLRYTLDELNALLKQRGATFHATAVTPRVTEHDPSTPLRAREILAYLGSLPAPPDGVVVLDDDRLDGFVPGYVAVDGAVGLEARHLGLCAEVLDRQRAQTRGTP
jgi:hypothetical protein